MLHVGERRIVLTSLAGLLIVAAVALAPGAGASSPTAVCTLGGLRYVGSTSQKKDICFTLTGNRKVMREYAYDYADTCGTGTKRALNPARGGIAPVTPAGVFVQTTINGFFKGVVRAKTATGTFRQKTQETIAGQGSLACDTHIVRWTAHRAP